MAQITDSALREREQELRQHYRRNAIARGHALGCQLVIAERNWPTLLGRPVCDCERIRSYRAELNG